MSTPVSPAPTTNASRGLWIAMWISIAGLVGVGGYALYASLSGDTAAAPQPGASLTDGPEPNPTDHVLVGSEAWVALPEAERPPMATGQDPREPAARVMEPWVWDYVDDGWSVEVASEVDPWEGTVANPFQAIFLKAPDGDYLRLFTLRTDIGISVVRFLPEERIVFLYRVYYEETQTVEFDLVTGTVREDWAAPGFSNVTNADYNKQGWFVYFEGTLPDGRDVWSGSGYGEPLNGVFFRAPGGAITPSDINPALAAEGYDFQPYCMGVDPVAAVAIYTANGYLEGPVSTWPARLLVHDLVADTWSETERTGPYPAPCTEEFYVGDGFYVGYQSTVDQEGLFRAYFDGRPDAAVG